MKSGSLSGIVGRCGMLRVALLIEPPNERPRFNPAAVQSSVFPTDCPNLQALYRFDRLRNLPDTKKLFRPPAPAIGPGTSA